MISRGNIIPVRIVIHLPFPVSVNAVWRGKAKGAYRSKAYRAWIQQAGLGWLPQKKNQPRGISGAFGAILILAKPDKRLRDCDNYLKVCLDFCQQHGLVTNDHLCEKLYVRWGTKSEAPLGAKLTLRSLK